jgi:hypothetical protein
MARRPARSLDLGICFDDAGYAVDWAFDVNWNFREALDIRLTPVIINGRTERRWTRGVPPQFQFEQGHIFYDNLTARRLGVPWSEALSVTKCFLQIQEATPDTLANGGILPGRVILRRFSVYDATIGNSEDLEMTQAMLVNMLHTGETP